MAFLLPDLPYDYCALEPYMSAPTLEFHHDKHHAGYVTNLNQLIEATELADRTLEQVIQTTSHNLAYSSVFNNAAQVWNHTFFWNCMKPNGGGIPTGFLGDSLDAAFGGFEQFKKKFTMAGVTQFGSGYAWLVLDKGQLKVVKTANAMNPLVNQQVPILTCDVWEHAYCLDYQNRRPDFLQTFLDHLVNWDFVARQFGRAKIQATVF